MLEKGHTNSQTFRAEIDTLDVTSKSMYLLLGIIMECLEFLIFHHPHIQDPTINLSISVSNVYKLYPLETLNSTSIYIVFVYVYLYQLILYFCLHILICCTYLHIYIIFLSV